MVTAASGTGVLWMPRRRPPSTLCCSEVMKEAVEGCVQLACAVALRRELASVGIAIRSGLHAGELMLREDGDVSGLAVHLAARVTQAAAADTIYVSSTVRDLLLGGDQTFADRGEHVFKGIDAPWRLYQLGQQEGAGAL